MYYNELDELLKLTKMVEATSSNSDTEEPEEDLPATVRSYDDFSGKATVMKTKHGDDDEATEDKEETEEKPEEDSDKKEEVVPGEDGAEDEIDGVPQKRDDNKAFGSSGNPTFKDKEGKPMEFGPLFEEEPDTDAAPVTGEVASLPDDDTSIPNDDTPNEECFGSIKKSFNRSMKGGLHFCGESVERGMGHEFVRKYMLECNCGGCCCADNPYKLGDVVNVEGIPMLFVVKNTDGNKITTAKPTACSSDLCKCRDGEWPEFTFDPSELSKFGGASLDDADTIVTFNDRNLRGFDGRTEDPDAMNAAQEFARSQTMDDIVGRMDEILGTYKDLSAGSDDSFCYTGVSPKVVYKTPFGDTTEQMMTGGYKIKYGDLN